MIKATMFNSILEVQIKGATLDEFETDLGRVRELFAHEDREFRPDKSMWLIKNVEKYLHIPFVATALHEREMQLTLC